MKVSSEALLIMDLVRMQFYLSESYDVYVGRGLFLWATWLDLAMQYLVLAVFECCGVSEVSIA